MTSISSLNGLSVGGIVDTTLTGKLIGACTAMPSATASNKDCVVHFIGTTTTSYTNGHLYKSTGSTWTDIGRLVTDSEMNGKLSTTGTAYGAYRDGSGKVISDTYATQTALSGKLDATGTAAKATADASGNTITSTYATKTELTDGLAGKLSTTGKAASAATADSATKATQDGSGNTISSTYLTVSAASSTYATKDSVSSALKYCGSKTDYSDLPATGNSKGDVYNVVNAYGTTPAGTNYAWDGSAWDPLGGTVDLSSYQTKSTGTANRALVSNSSGNIAVSDVTSTELGYLDGATSNIQTQINGVKTTANAAMPKSGGTFTGAVTGTTVSASTLKATGAAAGTGNIAIIASDGTIAYRTPANIKTDLGVPSVLKLTGASVTWTADTSVSGYSYKGTITLTGCTSSYVPMVAFAPALAASGNYCPVAESGTNCVYIWSKVNTTITVDVAAVL